MSGTADEAVLERVALAIDEVYDGWVDAPPNRCREISLTAARAAIEALGTKCATVPTVSKELADYLCKEIMRLHDRLR